jgi:hypothetical protein
MNFFVIASPPKVGVAISPVVIARLPVGKPWQSQERLLRRFALRNCIKVASFFFFSFLGKSVTNFSHLCLNKMKPLLFITSFASRQKGCPPFRAGIPFI